MVGKNNASILSQLVPLHLPQNSENERELKTKLSEGIEDTLLRNCQIPFVKRLESGEILGVKTWISYVITPGYVGCQLILKSQNGNLTIKYMIQFKQLMIGMGFKDDKNKTKFNGKIT